MDAAPPPPLTQDPRALCALASVLRFSMPRTKGRMHLKRIEIYDENDAEVSRHAFVRASSVQSLRDTPRVLTQGRDDVSFATDEQYQPWVEVSYPQNIFISKVLLYFAENPAKAPITMELFNEAQKLVFRSGPLATDMPLLVWNFVERSFPLEQLRDGVRACIVRLQLTKPQPDVLAIGRLAVYDANNRNIAPKGMLRSSSEAPPYTLTYLVDTTADTHFESMFESQPWVEISFPTDVQISKVEVYPDASGPPEKLVSMKLTMWSMNGTPVFESCAARKVSNVYVYDFQQKTLPA